jgi:quercetin dioxygenase-like cupin family protein
MPHLTRLDQVIPIELAGARFYPLSGPSRGGTELAVWQLRLAAGHSGLPHTIDREEVFFCISGEMLMLLNGEQLRLRAGEAMSVPGGSHLSAGAGAEEAVVMVSTRAGLTAVTDDGTVMQPPWAQ